MVYGIATARKNPAQAKLGVSILDLTKGGWVT